MVLTIILPVFNVGEYIEECLRSINKLSVEHEILLIHDAKLDNSLEGKEEFLGTIHNLHIIDSPNRGLAMARNVGMRWAKGDYVYFMDSDDMLIPNTFMAAFQEGQKQGADIIYGDYLCFNDEKTSNVVEMSNRPLLLTPEEYFKNYFYQSAVVVWRGIYKKVFLDNNNLLFSELKYHEDQDWTPRAICQANSIYYSHQCFYKYRVRTDSLFGEKTNKRKCVDLIQVSQNLFEFSKRYPACRKASLRLLLSGIGRIQNVGKIPKSELNIYSAYLKKYVFGNGKLDIFLLISKISNQLLLFVTKQMFAMNLDKRKKNRLIPI